MHVGSQVHFWLVEANGGGPRSRGQSSGSLFRQAFGGFLLAYGGYMGTTRLYRWFAIQGFYKLCKVINGIKGPV